ncbi:unnamed protein product [Rotaria sp. Silwood1]|nr:unnamed protein product [Rotaria sp. Silwood1]CAF4672931.1 unnamed protein product [Rotaria sp. Silwood1]
MLAVIPAVVLKFVVFVSKKQNITTATSTLSTATITSPAVTSTLSTATITSPTATTTTSPTPITLFRTVTTATQQSGKLHINAFNLPKFYF